MWFEAIHRNPNMALFGKILGRLSMVLKTPAVVFIKWKFLSTFKKDICIQIVNDMYSTKMIQLS